MRSLRVLALAGAAAITMMPAAHAADLAPAPPPPVFTPPPAIGGGWYLRGDIGMSSQSVGSLLNALDATATTLVNQGKDFSSAGFFGVGVGYQVNDWLRFDLTGEYRARSTFRGLQTATFPDGLGGTGVLADDYYASKSEWVGLANVYFDLGTWYGVTPFVGAGVGFARNTISNFRDVGTGFLSDGTPIQSVAFANDASKWNLAWAVHAGVAYQVTNALTVELAYRYLNLGDGQTGDLIAFDGTNTLNNPTQFKNITSHDLKLGIRYMFDAPSIPFGPPPLITKG